jgi:hypothetical protein
MLASINGYRFQCSKVQIPVFAAEIEEFCDCMLMQGSFSCSSKWLLFYFWLALFILPPQMLLWI